MHQIETAGKERSQVREAPSYPPVFYPASITDQLRKICFTQWIVKLGKPQNLVSYLRFSAKQQMKIFDYVE